MKLKVFPGRVVVKKREAKLKGGILLPPSRTKLFEIGEVVTAGDLRSYGFEGKGSTKEEYKAGDIVLFQLPMALAGLVSYKIRDTLHAFLNAEDIIAKLVGDSGDITIDVESFRIAGRFLLLQADIRQPSKLIEVPQNATEALADSIHFSVLQKGADVNLALDKGQEVFPNKGKVNPINIDGKDFAFVDQLFVQGALYDS